MCGIAGVFEYADRAGVKPGHLEQMTDAIVHRGPDDDGTFCTPMVGLGVRRLSIIDVVGGQQPMTNEDGSVVVVFNGEIYNYRSLRAELLRRGHTFHTGSDTEVLAHLYEDHGTELVSLLRGMFGFALWDARRERLLLARDRLGIKPLYYADDGERVLFGSEIKAILRHPASPPPSPDSEALVQYLGLKYVPSPATLFAGVRSLPPGCLLIADATGTRIQSYWDLTMRTPERPASEAEYAKELARLLRESVALHLQSDVPFGAFLSGGLDSSLVVALMSEVLAQPVKTFSIGFADGNRAAGELSYAAIVAREFATDHHELVMSASDFVDAAERVVWHLDQPIADEATVPMLLLSQLASSEVKMVLSGEGGDELFAGYARYMGERVAPLLRALPDTFRAAALSSLENSVHDRRLRIALHALSKIDEPSRLANWFPLFNDDMRRRLLTAEFAASISVAQPEDVFDETLRMAAGDDALSRMLYCDTKLWLPDDLLARGDKMAMASSIELRVPLLDHRVVEFAAELPSSLKLRRLSRKVLLRTVARDLLPTEILERKKEGFPLPMAEWFRGEAREWVEDLLSFETIERRGFLDPTYVSQLLRAHHAGRANNGSLLWGLVALELWFRRFIDRSAEVGPSSDTSARSAC